jgi:hypothetical protein
VRKGGEEPYPEVERQEGDGEESTGTTVDDDEDKKNPQGRGNHAIIVLADQESPILCIFPACTLGRIFSFITYGWVRNFVL